MLEGKEGEKSIKELFPDASFGIDPDCMMEQDDEFLDAYAVKTALAFRTYVSYNKQRTDILKIVNVCQHRKG